MNRKALVLIGVIFLASMAAVDARLPKVNDSVEITTNHGDMVQHYVGNVTDVSGGFVCMQCIFSLLESPMGKDERLEATNETEICIGVGSIEYLRFVDHQEIEEAFQQIPLLRKYN